MNNKQQIESKKNSFDIAKYAKPTNGNGRKSSVDGIYKSSFGISNMKDFLKNVTYNDKKISLNNEVINTLLKNMQNVKNWHLINNYVKCSNQKTIQLIDGGEVIQSKIWYCNIASGVKSPIFTKYTKKIDDNKFTQMAKQLIDEWTESDQAKRDIEDIEKGDITLANSKIDELLKISNNK